LRVTPKKPANIAEMQTLLDKCVSPTATSRYVLSHSIVPGETRPQPCPCCRFGHGEPAEVMAEYHALLETEATLAADKSKAGKARFSKYRIAHALKHKNVQPGEYGRPFLDLDLNDFLLDLLHLSELGTPKTLWKHGILNHASDDARQEIEELLTEWKHRLDCRRKDANRITAQMWFTGEAWATFCAGTRGSPGGAVAISKLVKLIADDM
jgi:hypothetical protein